MNMEAKSCPCGCGKSVDVLNIKAGRPFALRSCRGRFKSQCDAGGVPPDLMMTVYLQNMIDTRRDNFRLNQFRDAADAKISDGKNNYNIPRWLVDVIQFDNLALA
jgi:enamine deaminase RidA (YjgF/YER057c/UK114 family)